jgi:hypothetical protein
LGTVAAAAAIVGMVWLEGPAQQGLPNNVPVNPAVNMAPIAANAETSRAETIRTEEPGTPTVEPMRPVQTPSANRLAGSGIDVAGPRVAAETPVETDQTQTPSKGGGLRRVEEGESRLLPPNHLQPVRADRGGQRLGPEQTAGFPAVPTPRHGGHIR